MMIPTVSLCRFEIAQSSPRAWIAVHPKTLAAYVLEPNSEGKIVDDRLVGTEIFFPIRVAQGNPEILDHGSASHPVIEGRSWSNSSDTYSYQQYKIRWF